MEVAGDAHYPDPLLTRLVLGPPKGGMITGGGQRHYSPLDGVPCRADGTIDRWQGGELV